MAKQKILHVGLEKTGSTSIQNFLTDSGKCDKASFYYPKSGCESNHHFWISKAFGFFWNATNVDMARAQVELELIGDELNSISCAKVVMSSEHFDFNVNTKNTNEVVEVLDITDVILVLRNQIDYAQSLYIEYIKWGGVVTFAEYIEWLEKQNRFDFESKFHLWKETGASVHVIDYDRYKNNLIGRFLEVCNLDPETTVAPLKKMNESPGIDFMELVRQCNIKLEAGKRREFYLKMMRLNSSQLKSIMRPRQWQFPSQKKSILKGFNESNMKLAQNIGASPTEFLGGNLMEKYYSRVAKLPPNVGGIFLANIEVP